MLVDLTSFKTVMSALSLIGARSAYESYKHCTLQCISGETLPLLKLTAMTPEATLVATIPYSGGGWLQNISVRTKDLYDAIKNIPDTELELGFKNDKVLIKWKNGVFKLPASDGILDFLEPTKGHTDTYVQMDSSELKSLIEKVSYWDTEEDDDRKFAEVIHMERYQKEEVFVVHCTAKMLSLCKLNLPLSVDIHPFNLSLLTARLIKKLSDIIKGPIAFRMNGRDMEVLFATIPTETFNGNGTACLNLYALGVEMPYPAFLSVIPRGGHKFVDLERDELLEALKRVTAFGECAVVLSPIGDSFVIRAVTTTGVNSEETIRFSRCTWASTDALKFNSVTLTQAIAQFQKGGNVRIKLFDNTRPIVLTEEGNSNYLQTITHMRF